MATFTNSASQTITTKYLGATNTKPSRVKATTTMGISKTISWDNGISDFANHAAAAQALIATLNDSWDREYRAGTLGDDSYCFVAMPS